MLLRPLQFALLSVAIWLLPSSSEGQSFRDPGVIIEVGQDKAIKTIAEAARIAQDNSIIFIDAGTYKECAVWKQNNISIHGLSERGRQVIIEDQVCQGKAIFVVKGRNVSISNITFQNARALQRNGAGIRAEGANLTIKNCAFINNENGILTLSRGEGRITIEGSYFERNGASMNGQTHGAYIGQWDELIVRDSTFLLTHIGHHLKSRAKLTVVENSKFTDGIDGTASYHIDIPNGGDVIIRNNIFQKGPKTDNRTAAIAIGFERSSNETKSLLIENNKFHSDVGRPTAFVANRTQTPAILKGNEITGDAADPLKGPGEVQ
ncbi:MAG: right-handed parallel beta-helix repeat-containing protein [Sphingomonadales bacterium]|jgi:pectate lyase